MASPLNNNQSPVLVWMIGLHGAGSMGPGSRVQGPYKVVFFSFQSVIIDMRAMLNNAVKGDYMADTDPSVSVHDQYIQYGEKD